MPLLDRYYIFLDGRDLLRQNKVTSRDENWFGYQPTIDDDWKCVVARVSGCSDIFLPLTKSCLLSAELVLFQLPSLLKTHIHEKSVVPC